MSLVKGRTSCAMALGLALSTVVGWTGAYAVNEEPSDLLEKRVTVPIEWNSWEDQLRQLQAVAQRVGVRVVIAQEYLEFFKHVKTGIVQFNRPGENSAAESMPVKELLDRITHGLGLQWQRGSERNTVTVDLPWRNMHPRGAQELFKLLGLSQHEESPDGGSSWGGKEWGRMFNELLSVEANYAKAWKVRQRAIYEESLFSLRKDFDALDLVLTRPFMADNLQTYLLVLVRHQIHEYPGQSAAS